MKQPKMLDNKSNRRVGDELKNEIKLNSKLSIISAYFSIYAYKELKSELKEPDKKGGTVPVVYVETGRLRAFIPVEALAVVPWDWRAKGEPIRERLEALAVPDC